MTPLHVAAECGLLNICELLVAANCFKNNRDSKGRTPLLCAASAGHLEVVKYLIGERSFTFVVDEEGNSALHLAAKHGHIEVVNWLKDCCDIDAEAPNAAGELYQDLLPAAALSEVTSSAEAIASAATISLAEEKQTRTRHLCPKEEVLHAHMPTMAPRQESHYNKIRPSTHTAPVAPDNSKSSDSISNRSGKRGSTPSKEQPPPAESRFKSQHTEAMLTACYSGDFEVALQFLPSADPNGVHSSSLSALHLTCHIGNAVFADRLLRAGASTTQRDRRGFTALHLACQAKHVEVAKVLFLHNAQIVPDSQGLSPLHYAAISGDAEVVKLLLAHGGNVDDIDNTGNSAFHYIIESRNVALALWVVENCEVDMFAINVNGITPIDIARNAGMVELSTYLLDTAASKKLNKKRASGGRHLLEVCARREWGEAVDILTDDVDLTLSDAAGYYAIHLCALGGARRCLEIMLDAGMDVNMTDSTESRLTPLLCAVKERQLELITFLVERGADVNAEDSTGYSPLFYACLNSDIECATLLLQCGADPLHRDWKKNDTVMHVACRSSDVDMVQWLERTLENMSVNSQIKNKSQQTPLDVALMRDCVDVIMYAKESWEKARRKNSTDFAAALARNDLDLATEVLKLGIDPNYCIPDTGEVVFHLACAAGNIHMVKAMLDQGASLSLEGHDGKTAIHCASSCGQLEIIRWLKKCGCSLNDRSGTGMTPLHYACLSGDEEVVRWLIDRGANMTFISKNLSTSLHFACASGNKALVKLVMEYSCSPYALNHDNERPIDMAGKAGRVELVIWLAREMNLCADEAATLRSSAEVVFKAEMDYLNAKRLRNAAIAENMNAMRDSLDQGIDIDSPAPDGMTALHFACANRSINAVHYLLKRGCNVNSKTATGTTPLHLACQKGFSDLFDILVEAGADAMSFDADGSNILTLACQGPNTQLAKFIIQTYPQFNECRKNKRGVSPLHAAATAGHVELVLWLSDNLWITRHQKFLFDACERGDHKAAQNFISLGLDVNILNEDGVSPLHVACYLSGTVLVQKLLSAGAKVRITDPSYRVPLHIAAGKGFAEIVKLLCDADDDVDRTDDLGMTPLLYACKNGHMLTAAYLVGHHADVNKTDDNQNTALHYACRSGDLSLVQWLYEGYNLSECALNSERKSAIDIARQEGSTAILAFFEKKKRERVEAQRVKREEEEIEIARRRLEEIEREKAMIEERARAQAQNQEYVQKMREEENVKRRAQKMLATATSSFLIEMASTGSVEDVLELLACGTDPDSRTDPDDATALHMACKGGHRAVVEALLKGGASCDPVTRRKETPLLFACQGANWSCAMFLLAHGADAGIRSDRDICPLDVICDSGLGDVMQEALEVIQQSSWGSKFDPNVSDCKGVSLLHRAVQCGSTGVVNCLLQHHADINRKTLTGKTPLLIACDTANFHMGALLIRAGADVLLTDQNDTTCLMAAVRGGSRELVHILLKDSDISMHEVDVDGNTALHIACALGLDEIGRLLLDQGASFYFENVAGETPLLLAEKSKCYRLSKYIKKSMESTAEILEVCSTGDVDWLRVMVSKGVNILRTNERQMCGLHVAAHQGKSEIVSVFVEQGADVDTIDDAGRTPLHYACFGGKLNVIKVLVDADACITKTSRVGRTCAHYACQSGCLDVVKWVLSTGHLDINCSSFDNSTPLHDAATSNSVQVVSHLVRAGASVHAITTGGVNVFHIACLNNAMDVAKWLLDNCECDIDAVDGNGQSGFLMACAEGHLAMAQWLYHNGTNFLAAGGTVDHCDTGLHMAARAGHRGLCEWLVERGMNVFAVNSKDETGVDVAVLAGHDDLAEWLDDVGLRLLATRVSELVVSELDRALEGVNIELAAALLEEVCIAYFENEDHMGVTGEYLLQRAAGVGALETVKVLVDEGVRINAAASGSKMTPLHYACRRGHGVLAAYLLKQGADVLAKDHKGFHALDIARREQYDEIVTMLESRMPLQERDMEHAPSQSSHKHERSSLMTSSHSTADGNSDGGGERGTAAQGGDKKVDEQMTLHRVVSVGRLDLVSGFVEQYGGDVDEVDSRTGRTALHLACAQNFEDIAQYLVLHGAGVNRLDAAGSTPLHLSCERKNHSLAIMLVRNKADLTIPDGEGNTSLHLICRNGMLELLEDVIDLPRSILRNLNLDVVDSEGKNLLHLSVECQALDMASLFIRQGVNINCTDHKKMTPLHYAVLLSQFDIAQSLLIKRADTNARDIYGRTPMSLAVVVTKDVNFARMLHEYGADVSVLDEAKNSLLHIACRDGSVDLAKWLTRCGCDPNATNASAQSAVQLAHSHMHEDLVEWLLAWILSVSVGRPVEEILVEAAGGGSHRRAFHGVDAPELQTGDGGLVVESDELEIERNPIDAMPQCRDIGANSLHGVASVSSVSTRSHVGANVEREGKLVSKRHIALL